MKALIIIVCVAAAIVLILFAICALIVNQLISLKTIPIPKFIYSLVAGNDGPNQFEEEARSAERHFKTLPLEQVKMESGGKQRHFADRLPRSQKFRPRRVRF